MTHFVVWGVLWALAVSTQASGQVEIQNLIERNSEYRALAAQKPGERDQQSIKEMLTEGELNFGTLIRERLSLVRAATSTLTSSSQAKKDLFDSIFAKLIAPATGGSGSSNGSTSAVSGGGLPLVLGIALEQGAITQSASGTVMSLKGNLLGLARAIGGTDAYCLALECGQQVDLLRRVTFGVGFDLSRGGTTTGTGAVADTNQLVNFSLRTAKDQLDHVTVRFDFLNRRDIRGNLFQKDFSSNVENKAFLNAAAELSKTSSALFEPVMNEYIAIRGKLETDLAKAQDAKEMAVLIDRAAQQATLVILSSESAKERMAAYQQADADYRTKIDEAARKAVTKFSHAIEYSYLRPKNQPEISNIRYVGTGGIGRSEQWRFTGNFALDFYNNRPANSTVGVLRDLQLSAQVDRVFFEKEKVNVTLSGAAYYQWMKERALIAISAGEVAPGTSIPLPGSTAALLAPSGSIGLGQVKLTFGMRDSKIKIPVSFMFANRTELIKASVVRGQIGISYDFDSLFKQ
jgi:hypothetical protein